MSNELVKKDTELQTKSENLTNSERFTQKVITEFQAKAINKRIFHRH